MARSAPTLAKSDWNELALREVLLVQFAEMLRMPPAAIDTSANFEEYGLDSIDAVIATGWLAEHLGIELPPEFLFRNRSVDEVIRALLPDERASASVRTRLGRSTPIFFFPGGGGRDEPLLVRFRERIARTFEVVDIGRWPDWIKRDLDLDKVVDGVCQRIEASGAAEPLLLAGYSQGGQLAYATALALKRAGRPVNFIGLIDSTAGDHGLNSAKKPSLTNLATKTFTSAKDLVRAKLSRETSEQPSGDLRRQIVSWLWRSRRAPAQRRKLLVRLAQLGHTLFYGPGGVRLDIFIQMLQFSEMWNSWVGMDSCSRMLDAPVFLFRSEEPGDVNHGWDAMCADLTILPVTGDHRTMLEGNHLNQLVQCFVAALERAMQRKNVF